MATPEAGQTEAVKPPEAQQAPEKVSETAVKIKDFERTIRMQELEASKLDQMVLGQRGGIRFDEQEKDLITKERGQEEKMELEKGYFGGGREAVKDKGIFKKIKNVKTFFGRKTYLPEEYKGKDNILSGLAYRDKPGSEEVVMSADESHIIERRGKREYYRTVVKERGAEGQIAMAREIIGNKLSLIEETTGALRKRHTEDLEASIADGDKTVQEMMEYKELSPETKEELIKKLEGEEDLKRRMIGQIDKRMQRELAPFKKLAEAELAESTKMFKDISVICEQSTKGLGEYQDRIIRAEEAIQRLSVKASLLPMERDVLKAATQKREEYQRIIEGLNTTLESAEARKSAMETRKDQAEAFMERLNNAGKTDKELAEAEEKKRQEETEKNKEKDNKVTGEENVDEENGKAAPNRDEEMSGYTDDELEELDGLQAKVASGEAGKEIIEAWEEQREARKKAEREKAKGGDKHESAEGSPDTTEKGKESKEIFSRKCQWWLNKLEINFNTVDEEKKESVRKNFRNREMKEKNKKFSNLVNLSQEEARNAFIGYLVDTDRDTTAEYAKIRAENKFKEIAEDEDNK